MESPKNPKDCNVFNLYKLIATEEQTSQLNEKYEAGNFGFGHAKQELFELICNKFSEEREKFNYLMENKYIIEKELQKGAEKARKIAKEVLMRVRKNIGY
jgi:tryptophanyl-tRNA synthetase